MRSKTLSSDAALRREKPARVGGWINRALFCKNISRFWPLWAAYGVYWIIAAPVMQYLNIYGRSVRNSMQPMAEREAAAVRSLLGAGGQGGVIISVIAGCLFAMALFSYLHSARSVGMMHAFPIRRENLFLTNYLSGAAVFVIITAAATLLTAVIWGSAGILRGNGTALLTFFLSGAGSMLFFYSFAVFCAMFTGQLLTLPVFYGILNVLVLGIERLIQAFAGAFIYGYSRSCPEWISWMTPALKLLRATSFMERAGRYRMESLPTVGVYAAVGVALAAIALLVYRHRRSESAGDTVSVRCMRPVFRWGVALCAAFGLGQALYALVFQRDSAAASLPEMLGCMILCGLAGYYAAEMLLKKTFRVFRRSWRSAVALAVMLTAMSVGAQRDVLGIASRIPAASSVQTAAIIVNGMNHCMAKISDLDGIRQITGVQKAILAEKTAALGREKLYLTQNDGADTYASASVRIEYLLRDGGRICREYTLYYSDVDGKQKGGAVAMLAELVSQPEVQRQNLLGNIRLKAVRNGELSWLKTEGSYDAVSFDRAAAEKIYKAVERDIQAGHFGKNQFDNDKYMEETYHNTLKLYYETSAGDSAQGELQSQEIQFSSNCTELIAALRECGVTDAEHPLITLNHVSEKETQ